METRARRVQLASRLALMVGLALSLPAYPQIPSFHGSASLGGSGREPAVARVVDTYGKLPLTFEVNQGQTDPTVKFLARGDGYGLFLTPTEAVLSLGKPDDASRALHLRWVGANPAPKVTGREEQTGKVNYLKGNDPSGWRRNVPIYARVAYESVYPGIDLVFYGNQRQLEHDYVLAPGTDPRTIRFTFEGADRVEIDRSGELVIHVGGEEVRLHRPIAYQDTKVGRGPIPVDYRLIAKGEPGLPEVGFTVGIYDPETALVIDPVIGFSTYLGGSMFEMGHSIAVDAAGNAYVTGYTGSQEFPRLGGGPPIDEDAYVLKLSPSGSLLYSSLIGGISTDRGSGIVVDSSGSVYLTGGTISPDFPQTHLLLPTVSGYNLDAFVAKLDPSGSTLLYSTKLGGADRDTGRGIGIDAQRNIYVIGVTDSPSFPTLQPLSPFRGGMHDLFLAKLNDDASQVVYFTYLGGSDWEDEPAIAVDPQGYAYVTGYTYSADFPTVNSISPFVSNKVFHAFVTKVDPSGASYVYSTILGGSDLEMGLAIAADEDGYAYVTGFTGSTDFPILHALQPSVRGLDAFVTKLSPTGSLVFSTFFGGRGIEAAFGIALDQFRNVYITGETTSPDLPLKDAFQTQCLPVFSDTRCGQDVFVAKLSSDGSKLVYSSFLGGTSQGFYSVEERGLDIAADSRGGAYITGFTFSTDFPIVNAIQHSFGGNLHDAFVARIVENQSPSCAGATAAPASLWPPNGRLVTVSIADVTDPDGDPVTLTVTGIRQDEPLTRAGIPDATGLGTPGAQVRADRAGQGDGRVYHLSFEARDDKGGVCTGTVKVCVLHDRRPGAACGDGGPLFDSTASGN